MSKSRDFVFIIVVYLTVLVGMAYIISKEVWPWLLNLIEALK